MQGYEILQAYEAKFNERIAYPFGLTTDGMKKFEDIIMNCIQTNTKYDAEKYKQVFNPDNTVI